MSYTSNLQKVSGYYSSYGKYKRAMDIITESTVGNQLSITKNINRVRQDMTTTYTSMLSAIDAMRNVPWARSVEEPLDKDLTSEELSKVSLDVLAASIERRTRALSQFTLRILEQYGEICVNYSSLLEQASMSMERLQDVVMDNSRITIEIEGTSNLEGKGKMPEHSFQGQIQHTGPQNREDNIDDELT